MRFFSVLSLTGLLTVYPSITGAVVISNDIPTGEIGHWSVDVESGGESRIALLTAERSASGDVITENILYDYFTFIDVGVDGGGCRISAVGCSVAVSAPVPDPILPSSVVSSSGYFIGANGNIVDWTAVSSIPSDDQVMTTRFSFVTRDGGPIGKLRLLQYLDEDIESPSDDVLLTRGDAASGSLELFTIDNLEIYGVSQAGVLVPGAGLADAVFAGWAADAFDNIRPRITGAGQDVSVDGVINNLPALEHPVLGDVLGPRDVVTVLAWDFDETANIVELTTSLGGAPNVDSVFRPTYVAPPGPREIIGNIDPLKPTLVLTHGLQDDDDVPEDGVIDANLLWTGFSDGTGDYPIGAGFILSNILYFSPGGSESLADLVNIVQVVWPEAYQGLTAYNAAEKYTDDAGTAVARYLLEVLGPTYNRPIQFVGHSLGSVVSGYAARRFLVASQNVDVAQVTILDYPNRAPSGRAIPDTFFATLLQDIQSDKDLRIDNYYSNTGLSYGNPVLGVAYNHPPLEDPADVGDEVLDEGGLLVTDHSGVQMWYRWTMNPNGINGTTYCEDDGTFNNPDMSESLNPCNRGWYWSLFGKGGPVLGTDTWPPSNLGAKIAITEAALTLDNPRSFGCTVSGDVVTCEEQSSPFILFETAIPDDAEYIAFEYAFGNRGDGDYVAVLIDNTPIWVLGGENALEEGVFTDTGPMPLGALTGNRELTIALFGVNEKNAVVEVRNFRTSRGDATNAPPLARCQDVTVATDAGVCSASAVSVDAGSYDPDGDPITLDQQPTGPYPLGATSVTLSVTDDKGASDSCSAMVTVVDVEAPSIDVAVSPEVLWPANHKMVPITATVTTADVCDANPAVSLVSITASEGDNVLGDGNTSDDIQGADFGTDDRAFSLRAERSGKGTGRIYTITYSATDASGNAASASAAVTVPHNR